MKEKEGKREKGEEKTAAGPPSLRSGPFGARRRFFFSFLSFSFLFLLSFFPPFNTAGIRDPRLCGHIGLASLAQSTPPTDAKFSTAGREAGSNGGYGTRPPGFASAVVAFFTNLVPLEI